MFATGCVSVARYFFISTLQVCLRLLDKRQQVKTVLLMHPSHKHTIFTYLLTHFLPGGAEIGVDSFSHVGCDV